MLITSIALSSCRLHLLSFICHKHAGVICQAFLIDSTSKLPTAILMVPFINHLLPVWSLQTNISLLQIRLPGFHSTDNRRSRSIGCWSSIPYLGYYTFWTPFTRSTSNFTTHQTHSFHIGPQRNQCFLTKSVFSLFCFVLCFVLYCCEHAM